MARNEATRATTIYPHYHAMIVGELGCTVEEATRFRERISCAFDMGEPVWMIAAELALRLAAPAPTKTPRELAVRVVRLPIERPGTGN